MTPLETLDLFEKHARPWLNYLETNTCIEQTRILVECMKAFGVKAFGVGCKFSLICRSREYQFVSGIDPAERDQVKKVAKTWAERDGQHGRHVIAVVADTILVDLTIAQATSKEHGIVIEPCMVALADREDLLFHLTDIMPDGMVAVECSRVRATACAENMPDTPFELEWILTPDNDWESTPAWEPSHLWAMIHRIIADMWKDAGLPPTQVV